MSNKTAFKLIELGLKKLVENKLAAELPRAYENLLNGLPTESKNVELIDSKHLRWRLGITRVTEYRRRKDGRLPYKKMGKKYYYDMNEVTKKMEG